MKTTIVLLLLWLGAAVSGCSDGSETVNGRTTSTTSAGATTTGAATGSGGSGDPTTTGTSGTGGTGGTGGVGGVGGVGGNGGTTTSGSGGDPGTDASAGSGGIGGSPMPTTGSGGSGGAGQAGGGQAGGGQAGVGQGGAGGASGTGGAAGAGAMPDSGVVTMDAGGGLRTGTFKMLALTKTLEFHHDSIPACVQMITDLGKTADAMLPAGSQPGSRWDVVVAKEDLSEFTDVQLKTYELIFFCNPTGTVFSSGGANGVTGKTAIQNWMLAGGAWAGVHSATDFEKTAMWNWFHDQLSGSYFDRHDPDGTPNSVVSQPGPIAMDHPIIRGIQSPWSCSDEWYYMNRNPETLPGYTILDKLSSDQRPATWIHELTGGGRAFYTIRGHNITVYAEPNFRKLVHQGILWAVRRMK